jgi:glycosyltransferase involved in cell wall biosynthesis
MKRTLLICGQYPLPENSGTNIRTMNFVRFFLQLGTVDLAYSYVLPEVKVRSSFFSNEYLLKIKKYKDFKGRLIRFIKMKEMPIPICNYSKVSEKSLFSLIYSNDYDYIIIRYVNFTKSFFKLSSKYISRIIVDFDDIRSGSLYESIVSRPVSGLLRKLRFHFNKRFLISYEKKCLNFSASLFCSDKDKIKMVGNKKNNNAHVVPNIYHNESFKDYNFGNGYHEGNILLFVGALNYSPNIDGLRWFIESVFSDFKINYPDAKLIVIGNNPNDAVRKLCESTSKVKLCGCVPDVREYYKKCRAVIVPLLIGGGTRIKILEAALASRPILSTPMGAEGLDFSNKTDLLLFESKHDFSVQYKKLFDKSKYNSIIHNAKNIVLNKYSLENFNNSMEKVLDSLEGN